MTAGAPVWPAGDPQTAGGIAEKPANCGRFTKCRHLRNGPLRGRAQSGFIRASMTTAVAKGPGKRRGKKVSCEGCFFRQNLLCALDQDEPCATYIDPASDANLVAFRIGADGRYLTWTGRTATDDVACFLTDFGELFPSPEM